MIKILLLGDLDGCYIYDLNVNDITVLSGNKEEIKEYIQENLIDELFDMISK